MTIEESDKASAPPVNGAGRNIDTKNPIEHWQVLTSRLLLWL